MRWCWILGHRWGHIGKDIFGYPLVVCSRCLKQKVISDG